MTKALLTAPFTITAELAAEIRREVLSGGTAALTVDTRFAISYDVTTDNMATNPAASIELGISLETSHTCAVAGVGTTAGDLAGFDVLDAAVWHEELVEAITAAVEVSVGSSMPELVCVTENDDQGLLAYQLLNEK